MDAFLFTMRACEVLAGTARMLHATPRATSRLLSALQREQDILGAGK